ncbi:NUDIX hydrolase [Nocardioides sp. SYSU DS0651]|uniref:NUDIX hydrolase n=1 Tax=Nocardioides sp. SYSU DS0651 TaxID=3415955 RepID=UPI003F4B3DC5
MTDPPDAQDRYVAHGLVQRDGDCLFLLRRPGRYLGGRWDIPGGTVKAGEAPAEAAVRECREETGLRASAGDEVSRFRNRDTEGRDLVFHTITYRLDLLEDDDVPVRLQRAEHVDHRWLPPGRALELPLVWHVECTLREVLNAGA